MGIVKLFFDLRTCQPIYMEEAAVLFDKELRVVVENIVVGGDPFFGDLQWRIASLPIKGLGLCSAVEATSYAFVASRTQSWILQDHILRDSGVCGMDLDFDKALDGLRDLIPTFDFSNFASKDTVPPKAQHVLASVLFGKIVQDVEVGFNMTTREKAVFRCLKAAHAQYFLLAIPIDGLGQHMSMIDYRTILRYRLMIPLFPKDGVCPVCRKV
ncbi:auxilin-like protein, partial [Trifolium pratense]